MNLRRWRELACLAAIVSLGAAAAKGAEPSGDSAVSAGRALFDERCGICHAAGGTGSFMLDRRLGPDKALLATRTDVNADLVRVVVRAGIGSMPTFTRAELSDTELSQVTVYLTRRPAARAAESR
jgi:mono/diheme cytochrome c family protein